MKRQKNYENISIAVALHQQILFPTFTRADAVTLI